MFWSNQKEITRLVGEKRPYFAFLPLLQFFCLLLLCFVAFLYEDPAIEEERFGRDICQCNHDPLTDKGFQIYSLFLHGINMYLLRHWISFRHLIWWLCVDNWQVVARRGRQSSGWGLLVKQWTSDAQVSWTQFWAFLFFRRWPILYRSKCKSLIVWAPQWNLLVHPWLCTWFLSMLLLLSLLHTNSFSLLFDSSNRKICRSYYQNVRVSNQKNGLYLHVDVHIATRLWLMSRSFERNLKFQRHARKDLTFYSVIGERIWPMSIVFWSAKFGYKSCRSKLNYLLKCQPWYFPGIESFSSLRNHIVGLVGPTAFPNPLVLFQPTGIWRRRQWARLVERS